MHDIKDLTKLKNHHLVQDNFTGEDITLAAGNTYALFKSIKYLNKN